MLLPCSTFDEPLLDCGAQANAPDTQRVPSSAPSSGWTVGWGLLGRAPHRRCLPKLKVRITALSVQHRKLALLLSKQRAEEHVEGLLEEGRELLSNILNQTKISYTIIHLSGGPKASPVLVSTTSSFMCTSCACNEVVSRRCQPWAFVLRRRCTQAVRPWP